MKKKISILTSFILLFSFVVPTALACGPFLPDYYHTPQDIDSFYSYDMSYGAGDVDSGDRIIPRDMDADQLFPIYRAMINRPLSANDKMRLYAPEKESPCTNVDGVWIPAGCNEVAYSYVKTESISTKDRIILVERGSDGIFDRFISWIRSFTENEKSTAKPQVKTKNQLFEINYTGEAQQAYEYEQARVSFYAGNYTLAVKQFEAIAENKNHVLQEKASYSLARAYAAVADMGFDTKDSVEMANKAYEQYVKMSNEKLHPEYASDAKEMAQYLKSYRDILIAYRNSPDTEKANAGINLGDFMNFVQTEKILEGNGNDITKDDLEIYLRLFGGYSYGMKPDTSRRKAIVLGIDNRSQFTQWLYTWQGTSTMATSFAKKQYQKTGDNIWLVSLAKNIPKSNSYFPIMEKNVLEIPRSFPGYWTAQYYLILSYINAGDKGGARELLTRYSEEPKPWVFDYFEDLRMLSSETLSEAWSHSLRYPVEVSYLTYTQASYNKIRQTPMIDNKMKEVFDTQLPIDTQVSLLEGNTVFPVPLLKYLQLELFARAFLSGRFDIANKMAVAVSEADPAIAKDLKAYTMSSGEARKFAGALFLIRYPGIGLWNYDDAAIDSTLYFHEGYWSYWEQLSLNEISDYDYHRWDYCRPYDMNGTWPDYIYDYKDIPDSRYDTSFASAYISKTEKGVAKKEILKMYRIPQEDFASVIFEYAKKQPKDARVPEALSRAVKMTKFSFMCGGKKTSELSKAMFNLLHSRYANTTWAKNTPYYY